MAWTQEARDKWRAENYEYAKATAKLWRQNNKDKTEAARVKWKYGLSREDYQSLQEEHGGRCAICRMKSRLEIDHNHKNGKARGLLCHGCNVALGYAKENIKTLLAAADYLKKYD